MPTSRPATPSGWDKALDAEVAEDGEVSFLLQPRA
jgi:hypothetical protein